MVIDLSQPVSKHPPLPIVSKTEVLTSFKTSKLFHSLLSAYPSPHTQNHNQCASYATNKSGFGAAPTSAAATIFLSCPSFTSSLYCTDIGPLPCAYTSVLTISTTSSPGYQSCATLFQTQIRLFSPCTFVNRSYTILYRALAGAAPFAPHQNQPPSASCRGRQRTGTPAVCRRLSWYAIASMSRISKV